MFKFLLLVSTWMFTANNFVVAEEQSFHGELVSNAKDPLRLVYGVEQRFWPKPKTSDHSPVSPMGLIPVVSSKNTEKIALGKKLFSDPILSRDKSISCASCHQIGAHFTDGLPKAIGIGGKLGLRNTPSLFGLERWSSFGWSGEAETIFQQVWLPISNPVEMGASRALVVPRLNAKKSYRHLFSRAWGMTKSEGFQITSDMIEEAIVSYELSLAPPQGKFQSFLHKLSLDPAAAVDMLSDDQLRGLHLFRTKGKCMTCHDDVMLSDSKFYVTGFLNSDNALEDLGRYEFSGKSEDSGAFRTPSLLGVSKTGPWMHNGRFDRLEEIVAIYNRGGMRVRISPSNEKGTLLPQTTYLLQDLGLNEREKHQLVQFLKIL